MKVSQYQDVLILKTQYFIFLQEKYIKYSQEGVDISNDMFIQRHFLEKDHSFQR